MALPRKLKNFNLFNDANSYMGMVKSITLPKLAIKTESYRGGGMPGTIDVDMGLSDDAITLEWTLGGFDTIALSQFGQTSAGAVPLRFNGAVQRDDTGETVGVEINVRGFHKEIDMGDAKPGDDTEHKYTTTCSYYKLSIDGSDIIEIDQVNMVFNVNGEDRLEDIRSALGL
ncbi:phage major tail tube protein [Celerinatantimonas sp. MCCC 1A17872]|uniref:phage major tail tube protein n=1 Tax=Celerinatantimonas sp. MCCC 1A17872 TaxID=3177514 RepID=UPI0038C2E022